MIAGRELALTVFIVEESGLYPFLYVFCMYIIYFFLHV